MTGVEPEPAGPEAPAAPQRPTRPDGWVGDDGTAVLARWMVTHAATYTAAALDRSARAAGYPEEQVVKARRRADARIRETEQLGPIRRTARRAVVVAYGAVWLFLAIGLLAGRSGEGLDFTELILVVLSVSMAIALGISFLAIRSGDPDPTRPVRAVILLLALPTVLLVAIAGLCLPGVV
jgi:hypothetical protein